VCVCVTLTYEIKLSNWEDRWGDYIITQNDAV